MLKHISQLNAIEKLELFNKDDDLLDRIIQYAVALDMVDCTAKDIIDIFEQVTMVADVIIDTTDYSIYKGDQLRG